jgi:hypothetical protein
MTKVNMITSNGGKDNGETKLKFVVGSTLEKYHPGHFPLWRFLNELKQAASKNGFDIDGDNYVKVISNQEFEFNLVDKESELDYEVHLKIDHAFHGTISLAD